MIDAGNLFAAMPADRLEEEITEVLRAQSLKIERIVSYGRASPDGFWYDQDWDEWVIVLKGSAGLLFEDEAVVRSLMPGDYLHIPAHARHRVAWTDPDRPTVWLAVHHR